MSDNEENGIVEETSDVLGEETSDAQGMSFGEALKELHNGEKVSRMGWNGKDMWIKLQRPDENSKMTLPYIYMKTVTDDLVPWLASQTDILAIDWIIVA